MSIERRDEDRGAQDRDPSRRDFLAAVGAAVVLHTAAASGTAFAEATARPPDPSGEPGTLDYRSANDLVAMLVARQVSAVELLHHSIARIEALDAGINAVVVRDFDRAHRCFRGRRRLGPWGAAAAAGRADDGERGLRRRRLADHLGHPALQGLAADQDAVAVARLKAAGAVILGKTNIPIVMSDWQSFNAVYGTTNNPWDLTRTPGGSSGGAAASLAAGYVPWK